MWFPSVSKEESRAHSDSCAEVLDSMCSRGGWSSVDREMGVKSSHSCLGNGLQPWAFGCIKCDEKEDPGLRLGCCASPATHVHRKSTFEMQKCAHSDSFCIEGRATI